VKAAPAQQRVLLDIAAIDARVAAAEAQRRNPPQAARVAELVAARSAQIGELTIRAGRVEDAKTEQSRLEADIALAQGRIDRDVALLARSTGSKEAVAIEHEIASLKQRISGLEDAELEVMERVEVAEREVAEQQAIIAETNAEGARLSAAAKEQVASATAVIDDGARDRAALAANLDAALLNTYDRLSGRNGVGAGLLRQGTCGACRMVLAGTDLAEVKAAADDDVVFCPQCSAILVRTDESGIWN